MTQGLRRIASLVAAWAIVTGAASAAQAQATVQFNLPVQPLADSLRAVGTQMSINVLFDPPVVANRMAPALQAQLTSDEAFTRLLAGTGLQYEFVSERTVAIRKGKGEAAAKSEKATTAGTMGEGSGIRVTQAEGVAERNPTDGEQREAAPNVEGEKEEGVQLEEVVVTGTHIRGAENRTVPLTVLDRAYIDSTGIGSTARLIEALPQNFALASQAALFIPGVTPDGAQGASINLRGIGEGTTLTLVNGRRLAPGFFGTSVDISGLPLSAIERVEVLTDGASALYGSDAVGGVVNFILRKNFDGAETRLRLGRADGDVNEYRVSQALGRAWESGNALLSLEYYKRDLLATSERDFVPSDSLIGSLMPRDKNLSAVFAGRQQLTDQVSAFADALYTRRDSFNRAGLTSTNTSFDSENPLLTATVGLEWVLATDWQIEASGSHARNRLDVKARDDFGNSDGQTKFNMNSVQLKADGGLFRLPGGMARAALGADWRSERFRRREFDPLSGQEIPPGIEKDQIVRGAFGEILIPLIDSPRAEAGTKALEVSLAGRFDDYSSFGSSFDPQVGAMWELASGLRLRASYGTSYKAPNLPDYDTGTQNAAFGFPDPVAGIYVISLAGTDPESYAAQESESFSFGVQFVPRALQGLELGLNYYAIDYTNRIGAPADSATTMLSNPERFPGLITNNPSLSQIDEAIALANLGVQGFIPFDENFEVIENFDPSTVQAIVDTRRRNLNEVKTSGFDLSAQYRFTTVRGDVQLALFGTHILEREERATEQSPAIDKVGTIFNPPDWRVRGSAAWHHQAWAANLFVNHTDSYTDDRLGLPLAVSSSTTVDTRVAYELASTTVSLNVENLFDRDPPSIGPFFPGFDVGFDPTNASPLGRLIALELVTRW